MTTAEPSAPEPAAPVRRPTPRRARSAAAGRTVEAARAWLPLVILGIGLVVLLYSMQLGSVTTSGYDLQRLQVERNEWRQRNEQLLLELSKVQSLAWIEVEAVQRLGMRHADYVSYLELDEALLAQVEPPPAAPAPVASRGPDPLSFWRGVLAGLLPPVESGATR